MISPLCFDVIGYRQEEMLGTAMSSYYKSMEDRQKMVQAITDGGGKAIQVEAELRHKNNSIIWISTNAFVRCDSQGQVLYIEGVARDISQRKQMENRLTELSRTDNLTGVYNRRYFLEKSAEVIEVMRRYHHTASMLMMDLDQFKKINDKYGHHAGDSVLIAFADACRREIREPDVLGRMGGEEFCLLLPETSLQNAQILAERIRQATAALEIQSGQHLIRVTVSIGLVKINSKDLSLSSAMHRADLAMYQAKERGRNQVVAPLESASPS
jgi:diguanylate cyclase (GGDEF)-like protein/PAS domain S-box-containing protein